MGHLGTYITDQLMVNFHFISEQSFIYLQLLFDLKVAFE